MTQRVSSITATLAAIDSDDDTIGSVFASIITPEEQQQLSKLNADQRGELLDHISEYIRAAQENDRLAQLDIARKRAEERAAADITAKRVHELQQTILANYLTTMMAPKPLAKPKNDLDYLLTHLITTPVVVDMFYDKYERHCGDGFYPQLFQHDLCDITKVSFVQVMLPMQMHSEMQSEISWKQINNGCIDGLDGNCGQELLQHLNQFADVDCQSTRILSANELSIYPKQR